MSNLADLLSSEGKDWAAYAPPLSEMEIEAAKRRIGRPLPLNLLELYRLCDGGEGSLRRQPYTFILWGIQFVAELREHEHYREFYDRFVFFGGNGAGDNFGIDEAGRVFFMDPIAGEDSIEIYCTTFDEFVAEIGLSPPEDQSSAGTTKSARRAMSSSEVHRAIIFLKDNHIYIFTVAVVANQLDAADEYYAHDACHAQHTVDAKASVLGRDALAAMRAAGRLMSMEESSSQADPLTSTTGRAMDSLFCQGLGVVDLVQAQPAGDIRIVPYRFRGTSGSPVDELDLTISKDANTEKLGQGILEKLLKSQRLNSPAKEPLDGADFWRLIALIDVQALERDDDEAAIEPLYRRLLLNTEDELFAFEEQLAQHLYAIGGEAFAKNAGVSGNSDAGFLYVRCYVVAKGREFFEAVKADPTQMPKSLQWCEALLHVH